MMIIAILSCVAVLSRGGGEDVDALINYDLITTRRRRSVHSGEEGLSPRTTRGGVRIQFMYSFLRASFKTKNKIRVLRIFRGYL